MGRLSTTECTYLPTSFATSRTEHLAQLQINTYPELSHCLSFNA